MNFRIITKNRGTDPEIGVFTKSVSNPDGPTTAKPTALELNLLHHSNDHGFDLFYGA